MHTLNWLRCCLSALFCSALALYFPIGRPIFFVLSINLVNCQLSPSPRRLVMRKEPLELLLVLDHCSLELQQQFRSINQAKPSHKVKVCAWSRGCCSLNSIEQQLLPSRRSDCSASAGTGPLVTSRRRLLLQTETLCGSSHYGSTVPESTTTRSSVSVCCVPWALAHRALSPLPGTQSQEHGHAAACSLPSWPRGPPLLLNGRPLALSFQLSA